MLYVVLDLIKISTLKSFHFGKNIECIYPMYLLFALNNYRALVYPKLKFWFKIIVSWSDLFWFDAMMISSRWVFYEDSICCWGHCNVFLGRERRVKTPANLFFAVYVFLYFSAVYLLSQRQQEIRGNLWRGSPS